MENPTQLSALLARIAETTGVKVSLAPSQGTAAFPLSYAGETYTAYVEGAGEEGEKLGKLISALVSASDARPQGESDLYGALLGDGEKAKRCMERYSFPCGACYALDLSARRLGESAALLESFMGGKGFAVQTGAERFAIVKFREEETPAEYAEFLAQFLLEELGVKASVGVGGAVSGFSEIAVSYAQAVAASRMGGMFKREGGICSYREFLLCRVLEELPREKLEEYIAEYCGEGAAEIFSDFEMTETAEAFFESGFNLSEASRALYMHRNTLSYRLEKIERATGLNIRKFSDAVTFRALALAFRLLRIRQGDK